jgi:hypothetical protein
MKNIYKLFNNVDSKIDESVKAEEFQLTRFESQQICEKILLRKKGEKNMKGKLKKVLIPVALGAAIITGIAVNPIGDTIASQVHMVASKVASYFNGESKNYYTADSTKLAKIVDKNSNSKNNDSKNNDEDNKNTNFKEINQQENDIELLSLMREDQTAYFDIKIDFKEDITELNEISKIKKPLDPFGNSYYNEIQGYVLDAPPFENCEVSINGNPVYTFESLIQDLGLTENYHRRGTELQTAADVEEYNRKMTEEEVSKTDWDFITIRNTEIIGNTLIQSFSIDMSKLEDAKISLRYKDIVLNNKTITGNWNLDFTISNKDLPETLELNTKPVQLSSGDIDPDVEYTINSYAVTPVGVKIFGRDIYKALTPKKAAGYKYLVESLARIKAVDDLGNQYLMYPSPEMDPNYVKPKELQELEKKIDKLYEDFELADREEASKKILESIKEIELSQKYFKLMKDQLSYERSVYTIYSGPADENDEYLDHLNKDAKTLTLQLEVLSGDSENEIINPFPDKITIDIAEK